MPMARIITRSETCGQQLALDLIARGYGVEIVTPDSVPDKFADLELRVEENSGKLVASVEAHNGGRSASLDFVHHLRAPLADFGPRTPESVEVVYLSGGPLSLDAGPSFKQVPLLAKVPPPVIKAVSAPAPSVSAARPKSDPPDPPPVAPIPANSVRSRLVETVAVARTHVVSTNGARAIISPKPAVRLTRPSAWQLRTTVATAGMLALALVLALGVGRFGKSSTAVPEAGSAKVAVPSIDSNALTADFGNTGTTAEDAVVRASMIDKTIIAKTVNGKTVNGKTVNGTTVNGTTTHGTTIRAATINDKTERSRQHGDGLIARDTVVYLDASRQPARKAQVAKGVAANTVTYLSKPVPKPAK
jgi:hypothetical protein